MLTPFHEFTVIVLPIVVILMLLTMMSTIYFLDSINVRRSRIQALRAGHVKVQQQKQQSGEFSLFCDSSPHNEFIGATYAWHRTRVPQNTWISGCRSLSNITPRREAKAKAKSVFWGSMSRMKARRRCSSLPQNLCTGPWASRNWKYVITLEELESDFYHWGWQQLPSPWQSTSPRFLVCCLVLCFRSYRCWTAAYYTATYVNWHSVESFLKWQVSYEVVFAAMPQKTKSVQADSTIVEVRPLCVLCGSINREILTAL